MSGLPFFHNLHIELSRSWKKPFSSPLLSLSGNVYSNIMGSKENCDGMMPSGEETLANYLSPDAASLMLRP